MRQNVGHGCRGFLICEYLCLISGENTRQQAKSPEHELWRGQIIAKTPEKNYAGSQFSCGDQPFSFHPTPQTPAAPLQSQQSFDYVRYILRHKWILLLSIVSGLALDKLIYESLGPQYEAVSSEQSRESLQALVRLFLYSEGKTSAASMFHTPGSANSGNFDDQLMTLLVEEQRLKQDFGKDHP